MQEVNSMQWEKMNNALIPYGMSIFKGNIEVLLSRAQVPGGWLVLAVTQGGTATPTAITFYPDPSHSWDVNGVTSL
jgi:hypothetical protein